METQDGTTGCDEVQGQTSAADPGTSTLVLRVGYDGTDFSGFAAQVKQTHVRTVAGELERACATVLRQPVELTCAGRTDAGVHARAQHVSIPDVPADVHADRLMRSLTAVLPDDISVSAVLRAQEGFSARFDARSRTYRYRMVLGDVRPLFSGRFAWWVRGVRALDVDAMRVGARHLVGEHDFKSFCKTSSAEGKPTCRFVESIDLWEEEQLGERQLVMQVRGNAFLHNMVRTIVGTLEMVGEGRRPPEWVGEVLSACDRRAAGPCAPACGLTFWEVSYDGGALVAW